MKVVVTIIVLASLFVVESFAEPCSCEGVVLEHSERRDVFSKPYDLHGECGDQIETDCREHCKHRFGIATQNGNLNARPLIFRGLSLGEVVCKKVRNINSGRLAVYASICGNAIDTGLRGNEEVCCKEGLRIAC